MLLPYREVTLLFGYQKITKEATIWFISTIWLSKEKSMYEIIWPFGIRNI